MEDIQSVINAISKERGIDRDRVDIALRLAFVKTAKEIINWHSKFDVDFSEKSPTIYEIFTVVGNHHNFRNPRTMIEGAIRLDEAKDKFRDEDIQIGDEIQVPHDLAKFGRNGSVTLYKNIEKSIEEFKGNSMYFGYKERIGEKINAKVVHVDDEETTILDINDEDVKAVIKRRDRIKGEKHKVGDWVSAVIKYVKVDRDDKKITLELSRTNIKYLEALFHLSVPEVKDGIVTINGIARIPGERAKVSVTSNNPRVDAISAVIGAKGSRINSVSKEIHNEVIDCINYSSIPEAYLKNSLSPATVESIKLTDEKDEDGNNIKVAYVTIDKKERGKAIGRAGVNLKLAKMLTGYDIRLLTSENSKNDLVQTVEKKVSADEALGALFS